MSLDGRSESGATRSGRTKLMCVLRFARTYRDGGRRSSTRRRRRRRAACSGAPTTRWCRSSLQVQARFRVPSVVESGAARVDVFRSFCENRSRHHTETSRQRRHSHMSAAAVGAAAGAAPAPGVARVSGMRKCAWMASRFPAAVCPLRAAPSTGAWAPSPAHRRHADDAARRLSVRAASSKASKVGRFPPTPATDAHPLVEHGVDLGELCARWRAEAGKPGATVLREVDHASRRGRAKASHEGPRRFPSRRPATATRRRRGWRLLLSHKNENLYNAFALEVAALAPRLDRLDHGFVRVPAPLPEPTLIFMRACARPSTRWRARRARDALAAAVRALAVGDSLGATPVALYHDCVAAASGARPLAELYDAVGDAMASWGGGFKHGLYARFKNPNDPDSIREVVARDAGRRRETSAGYVFGLCGDAPPRSTTADWSRKPNNDSAGTQPSIARAVNARVRARRVRRRRRARPGERSRARARVACSRPRAAAAGPSCMFVVARRTAAGRGHKRAERARTPTANLASFRRAMPAQHASLAECDEAPYELASRADIENVFENVFENPSAFNNVAFVLHPASSFADAGAHADGDRRGRDRVEPGGGGAPPPRSASATRRRASPPWSATFPSGGR